MIKQLVVGTRVRCKSHQTAGTFEGVIKDTKETISGRQTFNVLVDTVNGAKMAMPFERWTSADEVEDYDNVRYVVLLQFQIATTPYYKLCIFESDTPDLAPGRYDGVEVASVEQARKYAEENGLVFINKSRKD